MRRCKWKNNSLLKKKKATIKITAISSRYESAECCGVPRNKENETEEKPVTQAGGCNMRPDGPEGKGCEVEKTCLAQPFPWNKKTGRQELRKHFWWEMQGAGLVWGSSDPLVSMSLPLLGWLDQLVLALQSHVSAAMQKGRKGPTEHWKPAKNPKTDKQNQQKSEMFAS